MMKKLVWSLLLVIFLCIPAWMISQEEQNEIQWVHSYSKAVLQSSKMDRPIFALITAPEWCYFCIMLNEQTLTDTRVKQCLNHHFIPVMVLDEVDGQRNPDLEHFNYDGFPNMFIIQNNQVIGSIGGYVDADELLQILQQYAGVGE